MSPLRWKINRIKAMSFGEVIFRLVKKIELWVERKKITKGWKPTPDARVSSTKPLFKDSITEISNDWAREFGAFCDHEFQQAQKKVQLFSNVWIEVAEGINWHKDPETGIVAPLVYGKGIDYRDEQIVGNCKTLWELSRHKHLVPTAMAYALTGKQNYLDNVVYQIDDWIEHNPFGMGVNWCSSLEVSLRLIAWSFVHSLIQLRIPEGLLAVSRKPNALSDSIYQHVYFIVHYLSRYSSANNHLIGELTGIWVGCNIFDLGDVGSVWAKLSKRELEQEVNKQVYNDGVSREQATYYHLWVNEYLLIAWMIGKRFEDGFSEIFSETVSKMTQFLFDLRPPEGDVPQIGDSDDGVVLTFEANRAIDPYLDIFSVMQFVTENDSVNRVFPLTTKAFWLQRICKTQEVIEKRLPGIRWEVLPTVIYPEGGYVVVNDRDFHAVFDAGSLGYPSIAAHGHADALNLCVAIASEWWIVDPGTYSYHTEPRWRNYFRGTGAHNTVTIGGCDQSIIGGAFLWLKHAIINMEKVKHGKGGELLISGNVTGFISGKDKHIRNIRYTPFSNAFEIEDIVDTKKSKHIEIRFHFHPTLQIEKCGDNKYVIGKEMVQRKLRLELDSKLDWKLSIGEENPPLGWYSERLGVKVPSYVLSGKSVNMQATTYKSLLSW